MKDNERDVLWKAFGLLARVTGYLEASAKTMRTEGRHGRADSLDELARDAQVSCDEVKELIVARASVPSSKVVLQ